MNDEKSLTGNGGSTAGPDKPKFEYLREIFQHLQCLLYTAVNWLEIRQLMAPQRIEAKAKARIAQAEWIKDTLKEFWAWRQARAKESKPITKYDFFRFVAVTSMIIFGVVTLYALLNRDMYVWSLTLWAAIVSYWLYSAAQRKRVKWGLGMTLLSVIWLTVWFTCWTTRPTEVKQKTIKAMPAEPAGRQP